ncbi:hypothetical protein JMF89_17425 [Clostridiaceae bacterium UIB06]|nr:hypothetical protein [Clostridiaceae bacterium UIB06]
MRILGLISKYFLILMVIQGFVLTFIDSRIFRMANQKVAANNAKLIGGVSITASIVLYLLAVYVA